MSTTYAVLHHPQTGDVTVQPGELVGRMHTAALRIDHPHISEAHAYVSLRDGELKLLALRGGLVLAGKMVREVTLAVGQSITLARDQVLEVRAVQLPERLLALRGPRGQKLLTGRAMAVVDGELVPRGVPGAALSLWTDGSGWMAQTAEQAPHGVELGARYALPDGVWEVVAVEVARGDTAPTSAEGRLDPPLRIEGYYDTVHIHRPGAATFVVAGTPARMVCELAEIGQPVHWSEVGKLVWPDEDDLDRLRKKWDITLIRFRKRLTEHGIRSTLIQPDGTGNVQLLLHPHDRFVERS